ncbi:phosphatase PAP2 family protein [Glycomyces albidus]|uniref:Phosphatase PAP2 family protein n=1 Tax=Glycomyces albidus TaxID=2656774 RepID=A0A6L5GAP1_9ACTN|nr:phosphatase PAP2 family protein [Glycomyces albidus]MQM26779.1 phosphatase PAP2 family protein [Glycomyces albidus]
MSSESNRSTTARRSDSITDRGVTVSDDAFVRQVITPLRRYIPVGWFDWEPYGKRPKSWWPDLLMFLSFLGLAFFVTYPSWLVRLDWEVRMWAVDANDTIWLRDLAKAGAELGQARTVATVTLLIAIWCALRSRSIRPLLMYVLSFITLASILGMKHLLGRPLSQHPFALREVSPEGPLLFTYHPEGGGAIPDATAFPSGHAVNSILLFGLIVMLIGGVLPKWARLSLLIAPPIIVFCSQVFLGHHWLSDEPAGFLLGLIIIRCAKRVPWHTIPLGPLEVFDPATRRTILISVLLIVGVMLTPTLHLVPALISAAVLPSLGLIWLWLSIKAKQHRDAVAAAAEAAQEPGPTALAETDPEIPNQQSDSHRRA